VSDLTRFYVASEYAGSGDGNNSPTTSACGVENFTITNS
jgi:hypothetical protein